MLKFDMKIKKQSYYINLFEQNKNNTRKQWSVINSILGITKHKSNIVSIKKIDCTDNLINDPLDIANEFNMYFSTVVNRLMTNLDDTIGMNLHEYNAYFPKVNIQKSLFLAPTHSDEVSEVINSLNSN